MYFKERIIGLAIYYVLLFFIVLLIYNSKNKKTVKIILIIYTLLLTIIAYFYNPSVTADLSRYFDSLEFYKKMNGITFLNYLKTSSTPLAIIYLKIVANMNNVHLLPAISTIIFYGIYFWILYHIVLKYKNSFKSLAIGILLLMISGKYMFLISGIRNGLAFILIIIGLYNEFIKNKSLLSNLPLYIMSILIHPSSFIIILIRLVFLLLEKNDNIVKKIINLFVALIFSFLFCKVFPDIIDFVFEKGLGYIEGDVYYNVWEQIISILTIIFIFIYFYINKSSSNKYLNLLKKLIILYSVFTCLFVFEHSIFARFTYFTYLLFILYVVGNNNSNELLNKKRSNSFILIMIVILLFIVSITRGDITALKF